MAKKTAYEFLKQKAEKNGIDFEALAVTIIDKRTLLNWSKRNPKSVDNFMALNRAINDRVKAISE
jgi:hypothetical protein